MPRLSRSLGGFFFSSARIAPSKFAEAARATLSRRNRRREGTYAIVLLRANRNRGKEGYLIKAWQISDYPTPPFRSKRPTQIGIFFLNRRVSNPIALDWVNAKVLRCAYLVDF